MSLAETYIQYGVPSNWAHRYELLEISSTTFKQTSKKNLNTKYQIPQIQITFVKNALNRQPIDHAVVQKLIENNRFVCCLCKGQKSDAYIIHHIVEYSISRDNNYSNLALLCPNDHDLAHRSGIALTNKISEQQIKEAKANWEKQVRTENKQKASSNPVAKKLSHWKNINPYKELQSFTEGDREYFFGRTGETEDIFRRLYKYNIVGLFGESGTGKTSLINAGLIPDFKNSGIVVISVRCLDEPIKRIRGELIRVLKELKITNQEIEDLAAADSFSHLIINLKSIVDKERKTLIIVIDQFEEIFTRAGEVEREDLSKGITESLVSPPSNGKILFLLSLREDYIGELWDWAHLHNLENAWVNQFRIKRLNEENAHNAIVDPIRKLGIKVNDKFILKLIAELKKIGDDLIYPPYLQIVCSKLFEEYKYQNSSSNPVIEFGPSLYKQNDSVESIISDYLSDSMLNGLSEQEKLYAQNILDLLTGPEGLRTFLNMEEISRHLALSRNSAQQVMEHLIKRKIVHPVVEADIVIGYELVHDFLSKRFFGKLGPDAQKAKTVIEIFRKAFRDWKQHHVLASEDRLEILFSGIGQLNLNDEEWTFLIKSSFSVYWSFENKWLNIVEKGRLQNICLSLLNDPIQKIVENAISTIGKTNDKAMTPILMKIIESPNSTTAIKDAAIHQFSFNIVDIRIIDILKQIIKKEKSHKLRKTAVYAFGRNINELSNIDKNIVANEISTLFEALNDSMTQVRKQVADVLAYTLVNQMSVEPLISRLKYENSILSRRAIVSALAALSRKGISKERIYPILHKIASNSKEDYRIREEANINPVIDNGNSYPPLSMTFN